MFLDSDIAKYFRCGKDKTAYITHFGIGDFIKTETELISKITEPFMLIFGLNKLNDFANNFETLFSLYCFCFVCLNVIHNGLKKVLDLTL